MNGSYDTVIIRDLEIEMSIGVHPQEKEDKQRVIIDLDLHVEPYEGTNDELRDTVCYEKTVHEITAICRSKHYNLVETLAHEILNLCLQNKHIKEAKITIVKPDIMPGSTKVGYTVRK